jgi:1-deoxy-D-xylulose 5-phosphate reductoisomerase
LIITVDEIMSVKKNFDVYFEIYGKKMKCVVLSENEEQAKEFVKNKIIFHKIQKSNDKFNEVMDVLNDFAEFLNSK